MTTGLDVSEGQRLRRAIGFDIGGTKIACGVVSGGGRAVKAMRVLDTPERPDEMIGLLRKTAVDILSRDPDVAAIGVGAAGLIDWPEGRIRWAPNNNYQDMPLRELLEEACGLPTIVDNDANVAAFAEARLTDSPSHMLFLTIGTGVGGGIVLDGQLYRGSSGIGGEVGHLIVDAYGDNQCGCGNIGCLEAVASGTALGRYGREAAATDPSGMLATLAGGSAEFDGEIVYLAAINGDPVARSIYARVGGWLGIAMASLVNILDVQRIVIGGGVATAGELLLVPARASLDNYLFARPHRTVPEVVLARQGVDAGWIGAGLLALEEIQGLPNRAELSRKSRMDTADGTYQAW